MSTNISQELDIESLRNPNETDKEWRLKKNSFKGTRENLKMIDSFVWRNVMLILKQWAAGNSVFCLHSF